MLAMNPIPCWGILKAISYKKLAMFYALQALPAVTKIAAE